MDDKLNLKYIEGTEKLLPRFQSSPLPPYVHITAFTHKVKYRLYRLTIPSPLPCPEVVVPVFLQVVVLHVHDVLGDVPLAVAVDVGVLLLLVTALTARDERP